MKSKTPQKVVKSPLNTKGNVSYSKEFPAGTSFDYFKGEYTSLIESEFTKEKAAEVVNDAGTWKDLKQWFDSPVKYSFSVSVSYTGQGTIEYYRPQSLQLETPDSTL